MAWKYKSITPKVLIANLELINQKDIINLVGRNFDYVYSTLIKTLYQTELLNIPSKDLVMFSIENILLKNFINIFEEIRDYSPKDIRFLLSAIMNKFEVNNVKALLRTTWAGINFEEAMKYITPVGRLDEKRCRNILENSECVRDVIELLSDLEYGSVLKESIGSFDETGGLFILETALDRLVYKRIQKAVNKLKGRDKKIAKTVLGMEIDSINIKIIVRCKSLGINKDQIMHYLIKSEILNQKELETAIGTADIKSFIESLLSIARKNVVRNYKPMLLDLLREYEASQSLSQLEIILDRNLLKTSLNILKKYTPYFNIGLILAFLNAKWFEIRNLRAILIGSKNNMPPEIVMNLLILPS